MEPDYIVVDAFAKVNLTLDVGDTRPDGYHYIESIMQTLRLSDTIHIWLNNDEDITITCDNENVPCDSRNIAYKCARAILDYCHSLRGCKIHIEKNIPLQAGLGGGSADGAAVLIGINCLLNLGLNRETLMKIGAQIGADIPFCVWRGTALCQGIGDIITPLPPLKKHYVVIVKPDFGISTAEAYRIVDEKGIGNRCVSNLMIRAYLNDKPIYKYVSNDFELALDNKDIKEIRQQLLDTGALCAQLSGSGSCVYGLFDEEIIAMLSYERLSGQYDCYLTITES